MSVSFTQLSSAEIEARLTQLAEENRSLKNQLDEFKDCAGIIRMLQEQIGMAELHPKDNALLRERVTHIGALVSELEKSIQETNKAKDEELQTLDKQTKIFSEQTVILTKEVTKLVMMNLDLTEKVSELSKTIKHIVQG